MSSTTDTTGTGIPRSERDRFGRETGINHTAKKGAQEQRDPVLTVPGNFGHHILLFQPLSNETSLSRGQRI